jgi:hypothetical protein
MPKKLKRKLKKQCKKKGFSKKKCDRYVYGTMENQKKRKRGGRVHGNR